MSIIDRKDVLENRPFIVHWIYPEKEKDLTTPIIKSAVEYFDTLEEAEEFANSSVTYTCVIYQAIREYQNVITRVAIDR